MLWLIKGLGPGGAEQLLVNHARVRDREAFTVDAMYLLAHKNHLVADLESLDVGSTCLRASLEWDPRWAWRLRHRLREDPVDVVHGHSPYVAAVTRLIVRTLPRSVRPGLVYTEHNRWPRHRRVTRLANRFTFGLDDVQLAVSDDVRSTMPRRRRRRVQVVAHGVDVDALRSGDPTGARRRAMREELGIAPDEIVIGTVANLRREKGYDVLLDAAADSIARSGDGARLRFVSVGQGPLADEIADRHRTLGLGDRFLLLGYRPDATAVMRAFDVFTLASRHEGLPVSLMEALALGRPVVATRVGGIPEMITDGGEGRLVPPDNPRALADAYLELAADRPGLALLGAAAARRGTAFDQARATATIEASYRFASSLAAARRARRRS